MLDDHANHLPVGPPGLTCSRAVKRV